MIGPESDIGGEVFDESGKLLTSATLLARLDDIRYQLHVKSSEARIKTKQQERKAVDIEITSVIPAEKKAADAETKVRKSEFDRRAGLLKRKIISQEEFDRARADLEKAEANYARIDATQESKRAQLASLDAQIEEHLVGGLVLNDEPVESLDQRVTLRSKH